MGFLSCFSACDWKSHSEIHWTVHWWCTRCTLVTGSRAVRSTEPFTVAVWSNRSIGVASAIYMGTMNVNFPYIDLPLMCFGWMLQRDSVSCKSVYLHLIAVAQTVCRMYVLFFLPAVYYLHASPSFTPLSLCNVCVCVHLVYGCVWTLVDVYIMFWLLFDYG